MKIEINSQELKLLMLLCEQNCPPLRLAEDSLLVAHLRKTYISLYEKLTAPEAEKNDN